VIIDIPDDWKPTAANINALPKSLKDYIHEISTLCDPSGIMRENVMLRDELRMFGAQMYNCFGQEIK
jgi:hypothetical protein